jgi:DNA-binding MarR family transcriptional regulator
MKEFDWFDNVTGLPHSGAEAHLILEIMHTSKSLLSVFSREMGLPMSQLLLLRVMAGASRKGIGVLEIARIMGINGAAITRQIKKMEEGGLVIRRADKYDGRKSYLRLSAKGRALFLQIHQRVHEFEDLLTTDLEQEDVETIKRFFVQLRTAIKKHY